MIILIQNLQKISGLAGDLLHKYNPDVMLLQEINLTSEDPNNFYANNTSRMGYGTAIYSKNPITNIKRVTSPYAEFGGLIYKKTIIGTTQEEDGQAIQFVSFHGYNGTPFKNIDKLVAHVEAVLSALDTVTTTSTGSSSSKFGPAVFAGDFNTWTQDHVDAITKVLKKSKFRLVYSWPYPGRDIPLDHIFIRGDMEMEGSPSYYSSPSDHNGAIIKFKS